MHSYRPFARSKKEKTLNDSEAFRVERSEDLGSTFDAIDPPKFHSTKILEDAATCPCSICLSELRKRSASSKETSQRAGSLVRIEVCPSKQTARERPRRNDYTDSATRCGTEDPETSPGTFDLRPEPRKESQKEFQTKLQNRLQNESQDKLQDKLQNIEKERHLSSLPTYHRTPESRLSHPKDKPYCVKKPLDSSVNQDWIPRTWFFRSRNGTENAEVDPSKTTQKIALGRLVNQIVQSKSLGRKVPCNRNSRSGTGIEVDLERSKANDRGRDKAGACCCCRWEEARKEGETRKQYRSANSREDEKRPSYCHENGKENAERKLYIGGPESTDNYEPVDCSAGYSTPSDVTALNDVARTTHELGRPYRREKSETRERRGRADEKGRENVNEELVKDRSFKDPRYFRVLKDLKKDYGIRSSGLRGHSTARSFRLEDLKPDVPVAADWRRCGEYWRDMTDEYKRLTSTLRSTQRAAERKTELPSDGIRKRITRIYPSGKEFSFEVKIPGRDTETKRIYPNTWRYETKGIRDSECECRDFPEDSSSFNQNQRHRQDQQAGQSWFFTKDSRNNSRYTKHPAKTFTSDKNCSATCIEASKSLGKTSESLKNDVVDKSNSFDAFATVAGSNNVEEYPLQDIDCRCEPENSVKELWMSSKSSKSWRDRICLPNPTDMRIMKRKTKKKTNLRKILIYPPRGEEGPPLTLYKNLSKVYCKVKGDVRKGFRYNVTYVQKFVSPTLYPCERKDDSGCSSERG